jgi:hypothetical protein
VTTNSTVYNPQSIIKKEAVTMDYFELGEIQEISIEFVITQKGIINKELFYIPKHLVDRFDGIHVWFKITEEEAKQYSQNPHNNH